MLRLFTCFLFFLTSTKTIFAQVPDDSTLMAAYNHALNDNWEHYKRFIGKEKRAVYSDFLRPEHLTKTNREHFKIVKEKDLHNRCKRIFIPRKSIRAYRINHKNYQSSSDTVDILISDQTFRCLKRNYVEVSVACGGTMGYIPDGRLIFNRVNNMWDFISFTTLYEAAIAKEQEWLKKMSKKR